MTTTLTRYSVAEKLGEGGMGVVYAATDSRLGRRVALKLLRPETVRDPDRKRRFIQEAKAASALNHPAIVTIFDIDSERGVDFIAMERVDGQPLHRLIAAGPLPVAEALDFATQIAGALGAAHAAGIIHRDIKPANIIVTPEGRVKVLDFGLAKLTQTSASDDQMPTMTAEAHTDRGVVVGTAAYMSPEQAEGKPVDARSDIFSFGAVLYEMLAGRRPFLGESHLSTLSAILRDRPASLTSIRRDVPADVERIVFRCLEKEPAARYQTADELRAALVSVQANVGATMPRRALLRDPRVVVPAVLMLVAAVIGGVWWAMNASRQRWAVQTALPEIERLVDRNQWYPAYRLLQRVEAYVPQNPDVARLRQQISGLVSVATTPPQATVYVRDYAGAAADWELVGTSPITNGRLPVGQVQLRIIKAGFEPLEVASVPAIERSLSFTLEPANSSPSRMVRVPGAIYRFRSTTTVQLDDYWLDKYEVTNKDYKAFIDAGGYRRREFWTHPFVQKGRTLTWDEGMALLRDATGRAGPATWELGSYPEGQDDYPVTGVSWFEAAAYAVYAGKSLPTIYHWNRAAGLGITSDILQVSNFSGRGTAKVGSYAGLGPFGTYDMAGNVKEWCWNESPAGRYILGGAWNDPPYTFGQSDAQDPLRRLPTFGFRCARYSRPPADSQLAAIEDLSRDYSKETPVGDDVFRFYKSVYAYDRTDLKAKVESTDDSSPYWRKEKISFAAAYGQERVPAYLFLPRDAQPPYQTVVYFPGSNARTEKSSENLGFGLLWTDFVIRSGRALLFPIYRGTYERDIGATPPGSNIERDLIVQWSKDVGRSVDYLETRSELDRDRIAYYGLSLGAYEGVIFTALEPRFRASVLLSGGLDFPKRPPEVEVFNFAPRVTIPTLMINGRQDFRFPFESSQVPLFNLLGTATDQKRHAVFEGGHIPPRTDTIREVLNWLDRYLGPVTMK